MSNCNRFLPVFNRRDFLRASANSFGTLALAGLCAEEARAASPSSTGPLAPRLPHFAPRAKRIIFLFMHGGPSQVDTFDPKPLLIRDDGKPYPGQKPASSSRRPVISCALRGSSGDTASPAPR